MTPRTNRTPPRQLIGRNIRPGMKPGGMSRPQPYNRDRDRQNALATIEAANVALEKRGFHRNPSPWSDMVFGKGVAARAEKERVQP
jgi:hypothetical protein